MAATKGSARKGGSKAVPTATNTRAEPATKATRPAIVSTDGRRAAKHTGPRAARYTTPETIRAPLVREAERRFRDVFGGAWPTYRAAFEHDVAAVRRIIEAYDAARRVESVLRQAWRPEWDDPRASTVERMLGQHLAELWSELRHDPASSTDGGDSAARLRERAAIVLAIDLADRHEVVRRGGAAGGGALDEAHALTLAAAVSILLSDGARPELPRKFELTCAQAFDRERHAVANAAKRAVDRPSLTLRFEAHVPAHLAAVMTRRRLRLPTD